MSDLWNGLRESAQDQLAQRDYAGGHPEPLTATQLAGLDRALPEVAAIWIPGVELVARKVFPQRHRGSFSELARQDTGALADLGFWPRQWAVTRMFAGTAKGFHIHPPHIPSGEQPEEFFQRLYGEPMAAAGNRPYELEQWDLMFVIAGCLELFLVDERAGMQRRLMRFFLEGGSTDRVDSHGVLVPPGVAHAMRVEGSADMVMVYGTSTAFDPESEGRLAHKVEEVDIPPQWLKYLGSDL